jgi:hypothetical protein
VIARITNERRPKVAAFFDAFRDDPRSEWFYGGANASAWDAATTDWAEMQRVSCVGDEIHGYLCAYLDRDVRSVTNIAAVCFVPGSLLFPRDLERFVRALMAEFVVVRWSCVAGSPNEAIYRRGVEHIGGACVGRASRWWRLPGGALADAVFFEVLGTSGLG